MQTRKQDLSRLRQRLLKLYPAAGEQLAPFLSGRPLIRGTVYTLRRKCGKPSCRCARGERHKTVVLTASIGGKTRLWTIPAERIDEIRERTEAYRRFRQSRDAFMKKLAEHQAEMLRLINTLGKIRTKQP